MPTQPEATALLLKAPHEYLVEALQNPAHTGGGPHALIPEAAATAALEAMYNDYRAALGND